MIRPIMPPFEKKIGRKNDMLQNPHDEMPRHENYMGRGEPGRTHNPAVARIPKPDKVKIGVLGTYKKDFHNHDKLGKDAEFLGTTTLNGVMYLVDGLNPYPLFYPKEDVMSGRQTLLRDYVVELYSIDALDYGVIQSKELRESSKLIEITVGEGEQKADYKVFVTDKTDKREPQAGDYIKSFTKLEFQAWMQGEIALYAIDESTAEAQMKECIDKALALLRIHNHKEMATMLDMLTVYIKPKKKEGEVTQISDTISVVSDTSDEVVQGA